MIIKKIGFIGAGNMATALINGLSKNNQGALICVYDVDHEKALQLAGKATAVNELSDLLQFSDVVILAVKPQVYESVLSDMRPFAKENQIIISIAAGISTEYIKEILGYNAKVVRAMPNTPALLGVGATALSCLEPVTEKDFELAKSIFDAVGVTVIIPEEKMNEIIAVNGSSPAFVYLFAKALIDGAVAMGIDVESAVTLVTKTLEGSAAMLKKGDFTPEELIKMVSSPGGTTVAALNSLANTGFYKSIIDAMLACTNRAKELSK